MVNLRILGTWLRPGFEMVVTPGSLITKIKHDDFKTVKRCDYLVDGSRIQLFNPRVADVKKPFIGEAKIIMLSRNEMRMEGSGYNTTWTRRV